MSDFNCLQCALNESLYALRDAALTCSTPVTTCVWGQNAF